MFGTAGAAMTGRLVEGFVAVGSNSGFLVLVWRSPHLDIALRMAVKLASGSLETAVPTARPNDAAVPMQHIPRFRPGKRNANNAS